MKIFAFFTRDWHIQTSYKIAFIMQLMGIFLNLFIFFFISKLVGKSPYLEDFGINYFSFMLVGIAFWNYLSLGLNGFSKSLRESQVTGTLEIMLATPTNLTTILIGSLTWNFVLTSIILIIYFFFGIVIFKIKFFINITSLFLLILLTLATTISIGIISSSFIIIYKKGDPVNFLFTTFSSLFAGVFYPLSVLPSELQQISKFIPLTYSLHGLRASLFQNAGLSTLSTDIAILMIFTLILSPISILFFRYSIKKAKQNGTLIEY